MKGQNYAFKIWKVLKISECYIRYLKHGSAAAGRPSLCSENRLCEEEENI